MTSASYLKRNRFRHIGTELTIGATLVRMLSLSALALTIAVVTSPTAPAADYPLRPIRLVVPYPAGGVVDVTARVLGRSLSGALGQELVIDNRPGASGTLGAGVVAKATPDGYTLLLSPGDFVITPTLVPPMSFDPMKDLVPVTMVSSNPMVVVANAKTPYGTTKAMISAAKDAPGSISYATPGPGTINHVAGEWMAIAADIKLQHVPYRGGPASANGIAAGDVALGVVSPPSAKSLIESGRVKVLAITGATRPSFIPPDWPTLAESGLAVDVVLWNGLFAPAGTPPAVVERLQKEVAKALANDDVRKVLHGSGIEPEPISGTAFMERITSDLTRYNKIIQQTGIRVDR